MATLEWPQTRHKMRPTAFRDTVDLHIYMWSSLHISMPPANLLLALKPPLWPPVVVVVVALSRRMRHGGDEAVVPPRTPHISGLDWIR